MQSKGEKMEKAMSYLKGWLFYTVATLMGGFFAGVLGGAIIGFVLGLIGIDLRIIQIIGGTVGLVLGLYASFVLYRWSIKKFILPHVSHAEVESVQEQ